MNEIWRAVPGYDGVKASSFGRVWFPSRTVRGRTYKTAPTFGQWAVYKNQGRFIVMMRSYGTLKIARLVCLAFKGEPPPGKPYCLHIDEDPRNNKPGNLEWGTQKKNLNAPGFVEKCRVRERLRKEGRYI